jgi:hypothetical protein
MDSTSDEPPAAAEPDADDVKARYKQALEHKQRQHRSEQGRPDTGSSQHEPHGRSGGRRQFRRKSGG